MVLLQGCISILWVCSPIARGDFVFGEPSKIPNLNSGYCDSWMQISRNGLELYFTSNRPVDGGDINQTDIWVAKRTTADAPWGAPIRLPYPINTDGPEASPCISADGLELYFSEGYKGYFRNHIQFRPGGYGKGDLWVSTRATLDDLWGNPVNLGPMINSNAYEDRLCLSADSLTLYFTSSNESLGGTDICMTTRASRNAPWGPAERVGQPINSGNYDISPFLAPDNQTLFFGRGVFTYDIYMSKRVDATGLWGNPTKANAVNSPDMTDRDLSFSENDSTLYFVRSDNYAFEKIDAIKSDLWQVKVNPVVDFNGDTVVDVLDVYELLEHWETTENSLYDIAPLPFGDGMVDGKDLAVLAEHLGEVAE